MSKFFIPIVILFISLNIKAQDRLAPPEGSHRVKFEMRDKQIQVERIAYFTEKMALTPEEAQVFWPIYNEMDNKRIALFEEKASILKTFAEDANNLNEKQINEKLNRLAVINQQEGALHYEYDAKFRKVLSPQKVMNLHVAEMGFRNYLLQTMRNRREVGSGGTQK